MGRMSPPQRAGVVIVICRVFVGSIKPIGRVSPPLVGPAGAGRAAVTSATQVSRVTEQLSTHEPVNELAVSIAAGSLPLLSGFRVVCSNSAAALSLCRLLFEMKSFVCDQQGMEPAVEE